MSTDLATVQGGLPAEALDELTAHAGAGISDRTEDFSLPFLAIAQGLSPQVERNQPDKYIPGLKVGDIFNTATRKYWDGQEGVLVVPCFYQKANVEWVRREEGGGFVGVHDIDDPIKNTVRTAGERKNLRILPNGHQLVETAYHMVVELESSSIAVVSMTSSHLRCSRLWHTLMKDVKIPHSGTLVVAPSFAKIYRLSTVFRQNDEGKWYTWTVTPVGWTLPEHRGAFDVAREFYLQAKTRGVVLSRPPEEDGEMTTSEEEVPF